MRRTLYVLTTLFAVSALPAQSGDYYGVVFRRPDIEAGDSGFSARLRMRLTAGDSGDARVTFGKGPLHGELGWAVRWADTLYAVTTDSHEDTTLWLGVREAGGYAGYRYSLFGHDFAIRSAWRMNLAAGDSLLPDAPPSLGARDSLETFIGQLDEGIEDRRYAAVQPHEASSSGFDSLLGWGFMLLAFGPPLLKLLRRMRARALARWATLANRYTRLKSSWRPRAARPGYAVPCPICGTARMQDARRLYLVRGTFLATAFESRTIAGCARCVRRHGLRALRELLRAGPRSLGGIVATPLLVAYDLVNLFRPFNRLLLEELLRQAGIEPISVRLDADGLTVLERAKLESLAAALAMLVYSDGRRSRKASALAAEYLRSTVEYRVPLDRIDVMLAESRIKRTARIVLPPEARAVVYRLLRNMAVADGPLTPAMSAAIHAAADKLGLPAKDTAELFELLAHAARAAANEREAEAKRKEAEAKAKSQQSNSGAGAGANAGSGPNAGGQQRRRQDQKQHHNSRPPRRSKEDLDRARLVLGVPANATWAEIERAYRNAIAIWHPDRAGFDKRKQHECTMRSQEITWAKEALRRAAEAQVAS